MTNVISVNELSFDEEVLNHTGSVLVDFYTDSCSPCQMMVPILDQLGEELSGLVKITKVDASENQFLTEKYQINSVPTFLLIKNGQMLKSKTGVMPPAQLKSWIEM